MRREGTSLSIESLKKQVALFYHLSQRLWPTVALPQGTPGRRVNLWGGRGGFVKLAKEYFVIEEVYWEGGSKYKIIFS